MIPYHLLRPWLLAITDTIWSIIHQHIGETQEWPDCDDEYIAPALIDWHYCGSRQPGAFWLHFGFSILFAFFTLPVLQFRLRPSGRLTKLWAFRGLFRLSYMEYLLQLPSSPTSHQPSPEPNAPSTYLVIMIRPEKFSALINLVHTDPWRGA